MTDVKYMDLNEFVEQGFLQEANRLFFHPRGLALEMLKDDDGRVTGFGGVWDCRDDPEGVLFGPEMLDADKASRVAMEFERHLEARRALWGYVQGIQPLDPEPVV